MRRVRTINIDDTETTVENLDVDDYNDGEWLYVDVFGTSERPFLVLSASAAGSQEGPEGYHTEPGVWIGDRWRHQVSEKNVAKGVPEGSPIYLYEWLSPEEDRDILRASGTMLRGPASTRDPSVGSVSSPLVLDPVKNIDTTPGDPLLLKLGVRGGLPPFRTVSSWGRVMNTSIRLDRPEPRQEQVSVSVSDGIRNEESTEFLLRVFSGDSFTYGDEPFSYGDEPFVYTGED